MMESFDLTRFVLLRAIAFIYTLGFVAILQQWPALCGSKGLQPAKAVFQQLRFWDAPSIFWLSHSDRSFRWASWLGLALSLFALSGLSDQLGFAPFILTWILLWALYLSFANCGRIFYGYGWESLLVEAGFLCLFLGPAHVPAPWPVIYLFRWLLFRVMFGAGLIKLRGDRCWKDLTCLDYHFETQPIPNPLSWYFHQCPSWFQKTGVLYNHFVELVAPWGYFLVGIGSYLAGAATALFQFILILSGNLSWLNYLTLAITLSCFDDAFWRVLLPAGLESQGEAPFLFQWASWIITAVIAFLSVEPTRNLFSPRQAMNRSYDSLRLVNTYGAFGSITKVRREVIVLGTMDPVGDEDAEWKEYEFKGKPGDPSRRPAIISPYHYRLDWQMWFAAMGDYRMNPWFVELAYKLLEGDPSVLKLLRENPFPDQPPRYIRADLYEYHFVPWGDRSGNWWQRRRIKIYLPAVRKPGFM